MDPTTWVEVDTGALGANLRALREHVGVPVCAVVKSNAYGLGLVGAARAFVDAGAAMLAVTRIEEARALRAAGIDAPVLILMPVFDVREAIALGCDITVGSAAEVAGLPSDAGVHLKVDTGNGRLGVVPAEAFRVASQIRERARLEAVWTHFSDAAGVAGERQLELFDGVVRALRDGGIGAPAHAANSAACIALPKSRYEMVRAGTVLYGQHPAGVEAPWPLTETFRWYARVSSVRTVPAGATVGYGHEWRAKADTRIATIPIGYADGYALEPIARMPSPREIARRVKNAVMSEDRVVYFDDRPAPVVGRIAMQALTCVVDDMPDVAPGSIARIPARRILVNPVIEREYV